MASPIPLAETQDGVEGNALEDLRWYFHDSKTEQSGLRTSHVALVRVLETGGAERNNTPPSFDLRKLEHVRRARRIEKALHKAGDVAQYRLREFFRKEHAKLYKAGFGDFAGLAPSSPAAWSAYRRSDYPGGFTEWLRHFSLRICSGGSKEEKKVWRAIKRDAEERLAEALKCYRRGVAKVGKL